MDDLESIMKKALGSIEQTFEDIVEKTLKDLDDRGFTQEYCHLSRSDIRSSFLKAIAEEKHRMIRALEMDMINLAMYQGMRKDEVIMFSQKGQKKQFFKDGKLVAEVPATYSIAKIDGIEK